MSEKALKKLRKAVEKAGSQSAFGRLHGIAQGDVSQLLSGKRRPTLQMAVRLQDALGIPPKAWVQS